MNLVSIDFFHLLEFRSLLLLQVYRGCRHLFKSLFMHLFYESIVVSVLVYLLELEPNSIVASWVSATEPKLPYITRG